MRLATGGLSSRCQNPTRICAPARAPVAPRQLVIVRAKQGKGGGKGGGGSAFSNLLQKKKVAEEAAVAEAASDGGMDRARADQWGNPEARMLLFLVCQSYWKATKSYLMEGVDFADLSEAVFRAPFVLLVHNRFQEGVTDPTFTYANKAALKLWQGTWDTIVGMPSSTSAPDDPATQQERQRLLDNAAKSGLIQNYEGWRVSQQGTRFKIKNVTLFNVTDIDGALIGQAAVFNKYELEDGSIGETTGEDLPPRPSTAEMDDAVAAATAQADWVRALKEEQGLTNQDPQVRAAVEGLRIRKKAVADLQQRLTEQLIEDDRLMDEAGA